METAHPNLAENPLKTNKFKGLPQKGNGISFWAFLLSMLIICISLLYVFNPSPSSLLSTTNFWFFISNTLVLIIAADSGAFSSLEKPDHYAEYARHSRAHHSSFELQYQEIIKKKSISPQPEAPDHELNSQEKKSIQDKCVESKCIDKAITVTNSENRTAVGDDRSNPKKHEAIEDHENEFSSMTDEELNRRIEEFIQRFNRQIRLQAESKYSRLMQFSN